MNIRQAFSRANSHFRFHSYREEIGNPVPWWHTAYAWCRRLVFELKHN